MNYDVTPRPAARQHRRLLLPINPAGAARRAPRKGWPAKPKTMLIAIALCDHHRAEEVRGVLNRGLIADGDLRRAAWVAVFARLQPEVRALDDALKFSRSRAPHLHRHLARAAALPRASVRAASIDDVVADLLDRQSAA